MAIDRNTSFSVENSESYKPGSLSSISSARAQRREDIRNIQNGGGEEYIKMLREQIEALEKINDLHESERKKLRDANLLLKEQEEFQLRKDNDYEKYLKNLQEIFKTTEQLSDVQYAAGLREVKNIEDQAEKKAAIKKLDDESIERQKEYNSLLKQANEMIETNKEASKSQLTAFTEGIHNLKDEIGKLSVIKGVGDISSGLFDKGNSASMYNVYRNTSAQLGLSNSEFNRFKLDLTKQLAKSDNFFNFGWKDTADYLNKLGDLNITSQEMAEQQYLAVIQGTKYLGLTTETQAKILKVARDTNNMNLLTQTNETMVQIMNAQLGVSKDQLNQMANQAASLTDMSVFLGGDGRVMQQLFKIQAAVTKEYGKSASDAAMNILTEIMNNPSGNRYLTNGFISGNYNQIVQYAQSGQMDEAVKLIIQSVRGSNATRVAGSNIYAANALGADNNVMALANATGSMENVNKSMSDINSASKDIAETIREFNQDWSDKIINAGSNILSLLPFSQVLTLQNVYYALATVELLTKLPATMKIIGAFLKTIAFNTNKMAPSLDGTNPKGIQAVLGTSLSPLVAIAAGVASLAMFVNDASNGASNADKWGTGKTAAAIGGFIGGTDENGLSRTLKNAGKYALAGAAIGSIFPGIGNVAGWVIGGLIGLVAGGITGGIGGERIANGIDDIFGRRKDTGEGAAPDIHIPTGSTNGMGAAGGFPWHITSPFGPRTLSNGDKSHHNGVDFGIRTGTPIGAPVSGVVSSTQVDNRNTFPKGPKGAGSGIYLLGDNGILYQFWHLSHVGVQKGQRVNAGEMIGLSGNTGYSTGAHLHFGTKISGSWKNPLPYATSGLFEANGDKYINQAALLAQQEESKEGEKLLQTVISADTLSNQSKGIGAGNDDVVEAVTTGFAGLNAKLEELSTRQDTQEEVLRILTSGKSSSILRY